MSVLALIAWLITASGGLYLLSIWLIEYDKDFHAVAATRLPPPVLAGHVVLAGGGLLVWIAYLVFDSSRLAWTAVAALALAATLGSVMAVRWLGVYRADREATWARRPAAHLSLDNGESTISGDSRAAALAPPAHPGAPERNFPAPVVIAHGVFAVITFALVLLTAFDAGGS